MGFAKVTLKCSPNVEHTKEIPNDVEIEIGQKIKETTFQDEHNDIWNVQNG